MYAMTFSMIALVLAGVGPVATAAWLPATGTGTCSITDIDLADTTHGFAAGSLNCGLVTNDGGRSWVGIDVAPQQVQSLAWVHAANATDLYAARGNLFASADGGQNWTRLSDFGPGGSFFDIHFHDATNLVAIRSAQILVSTNGGIDWQIAHPGEFEVNFNELHFPNPQLGYATGGAVRDWGEIGTVLRSDDGGNNWRHLAFDHGKITAADFVDADHAVVATQSQGLFTTTDGGYSWQPIANVPRGDYVTDLAHRDAMHWYATSTSGCLYETHDAGQTWQKSFCDPAQRGLSSISVSGSATSVLGCAAVAAGYGGLVIYENRRWCGKLDPLD